jgi:glycosyltransferase involved in cell wall biosynthesis
MPAVEENNEAGFWESVAVYELNEAILASAGSSWDDWRAFNREWTHSPAAEHFRKAADRALKTAFGDAPLWLIKDPRICRLAHFWMEVLAERGVRPLSVIPLRNPLEVAASLHRRDDFGLPKASLLWLRHVLDAEAATRNLPRAFVTYPDLLQDWRRTVRHMQWTLGLSWSRWSATAEVEIDSFLNARLRHNLFTTQDLEQHPAIASWVKTAFRALLDIARHGESPATLSTLDEVREELNRADEAIGAAHRADEIALIGLRQRQEEAEIGRAALADEVADQRRALADRVSQIGKLESALGERDGRIAELESALGERDGRIAELESEILAQEQRIEDLESSLSRTQEEGRKLRREVEETQAIASRLEASLAKRDSEINELGKAAKNGQDRTTELEHLLLEMRGNLSQVHSALSTNQYQLRVTEQHKDALAFRLNAIQSGAVWPAVRTLVAIEQRWPRLARSVGAFPKLAWWALTFRLTRRLAARAEARRLIASGLFDEDWYIRSYPDVPAKGMRAIAHWSIFGWRACRNPNPLFDTAWYLERYPEAAAADTDPLLYYLDRGSAAGHDPHPNFDSSWYLEQNPDVVAAGLNPLGHYLLTGFSEGRETRPAEATSTIRSSVPADAVVRAPLDADISCIVGVSADLGVGALSSRRQGSNLGLSDEVAAIRESRFFDAEYYLDTYPEVAEMGIDPAEHYCRYGWRARKNPSAFFDTGYYLYNYPDIAESGANPLYHYIIHGIHEERATHARPGLTDGYEPQCRFGPITTDIKLIAFYSSRPCGPLRRNAAITDRSAEWARIRSASPLFEGHDQPRVPHPDLGYYDTTDWQTLDQQAKLARSHGIYGFCFSLLPLEKGLHSETMLRHLLEHPEIDLRFCLAWSVEKGTEPLAPASADGPITPGLAPCADPQLVDLIRRAISDRRYLSVDNRPLVLLLRLCQLHHPQAAVAGLHSWIGHLCAGTSPYIVSASGHSDLAFPTEDLDCEARVELPPGLSMDHIAYEHRHSSTPSSCLTQDYRSFFSRLRKARRKQPTSHDLYRTVMLRWDETAISTDEPCVLTGFSTRFYREWLDCAIAETRTAHPFERRIVFINAWNDWAHGAYLEPDERFGYRLLNETSRALLGASCCRAQPKLSVIVPNYNHARFLRQRLESIYNQTYRNIEVILLDDASSDESCAILDAFAAAYPDITTTHYNTVNSGGVFKQWRKGIQLAQGELVWIAESDDFCDHNFVETLISAFEDEAVLLAYAQPVFVDERGAPQEWTFRDYLQGLNRRKWNQSYTNTAHDEVRSALGIKNTIPNVSGVVFRKPHSLALLADPAWADMRICGDWVFYLHLLRGGKIAYRTETRSYFRFHSSNSSVSTYASEAYYREHGTVALHSALLYDIPEEVLRNNYKTILEFYHRFVAKGQDEVFDRLFQLDQALAARNARLPNIMISLLAFSTGGAEVTPLRVANALRRRGVSVLVHSRDYVSENEHIRSTLFPHVPVVRIASRTALKRAVKDFGIEVINSHHHAFHRLGLEEPRIWRGVRHVGSLHGIYEIMDAESPQVLDNELPSIDRSVDCWTYVAEKNLAPFKKRQLFSDGRFFNIPNGLEPGEFGKLKRPDIGLPERAFVMCCVSRAIPEKGWIEGIEIIRRARDFTGRDIHLILVGNGPVYERLRREGTDSFVHAVGFHDNPIDYFAISDMGFLPSRYRGESLPNSIIEAFFAGKPVIATDLGDIRQMLTADGRLAGAIIPVNDWQVDIATGAEHVAAFATDRAQYLEAADVVASVAPRYHLEAVVDQYLKVFAGGRELCT